MIKEEAKTRMMLAKLKQECEQAKYESSRSTIDEDDSGWCEVVWDNILCWNKTQAGSVARLRCPSYITRFTPTEFAERICTDSGTWWFSSEHNSSWTNFSKCVIPPLDISSHTKLANNLILMYTIGYCISLVSLVVAITIMLYWRHLRSKSTSLHINLFIAFIMRASLSFMKDRLFVGGLGLPGDVREGQTGLDFIQEGIHWECRTLFVLLMFAISASQTWMLMEGLYLYLLVHKTMTTEWIGIRPYIIIGWALPWIFLIPWIVVKSIYENKYCWNIQENPAIFWILKGPLIAFVVINFFFFIDMIYALTTRARNNQRHAGRSQYWKVGKFILVLIPLFGIMYIVLTVAFPSEVRGLEYNVVYLYIEMGYNSFQGFILALLFCFLNEDVHSEIRRSWMRQRLRKHNSSTMQRQAVQRSRREASMLSGIRMAPSQEEVNMSCKKSTVTYDTNAPKLLNAHPTSSTYQAINAAPLKGDGTRPIILLANGSCNGLRDNVSGNLTVL